MTFQRIIEMTLKPPFKYFIVKEGYFGAVCDELCFNSLSKAKETAEKLFLETKELYTIYSIKYINDDWQTRAGWLCGNILSLDIDCTWIKESWDNVIHVAFLWNGSCRKWNSKLYDKIKKLFVDDVFDYTKDDDWEFVKKTLGIDDNGNEIKPKFKTDDFKKDVDKLSKKVLKKFDEFILANEELTMLVQKKYPKIRAEYGIFDRMIMFYEEDENGYKDKEFQSLEEVEKYYKGKE